MTAVETTTDSTADKPRRDVLCGLVVALLAPGALVAACSSDSGSGDSGAGTPGGGGSGGTGGASGTKLAAVADVPEGGGMLVNMPSGKGKILLVRTSSADVKAFNAACKHQGTIVSPPKNGTIICPAHNSQYDATTGALKRGPATSGLDVIQVKVDGSDVVLA